MKTSTYKVIYKAIILFLYVGLYNIYSQEDPNDCIQFNNCPQEDIFICADTYNPDNPSEWGAILETWTVPNASETCSLGSGGNSFFMDFTLNEALLGKDCWDFNFVQRVGTGGGYLKLFSSQTGPISYIITPYLYLETTDTASIQVTYTGGNYRLNVYYIDQDGNQSPIQDTFNFNGQPIDVYDLTMNLNIPIDDSYRVKYEFVYTGAKPSATNIADKIGIDGVVIEGSCTGGVEFTVSGPEPPEFLPVGVHQLCYVATYTDPNGTVYTEECCLTVHVVDTPPIITCPEPITQDADPSTCTANVTIPTPTATDEDCAGTNLTANLTITSTRSDGLALTDPYPVGVTTITHTATDDNGASVDCEQTVTISGGTNPVFDSTPTPIAHINCNDSLPVQETLTASNCNGPVTVVPSVDAYTVDVCNGYDITYRWTAGTTEITETFSVLPDTAAPSIDTPASDSTVECSSSNGTEFADWLNNNGGAVASDLCGSVTWSKVGDTISDECGTTGAAVVTFRATDDCGNFSETTATFTIQDTTPPTIDTPASDSTVECSSSNGTEFADWLNNNGGAVASDLCGSITWTKVGDSISDECGTTGAAIVTFRATDDCGNFSETTASFTIQDTTPPTIDTPASDSTVECSSSNGTEFADWLNNNGGAVASDLCGSVTWTKVGDTISDECGTTGAAVVTFRATDDCGNFSETTATFTIEDTTAPDITAPVDITIECGDDTSETNTGTPTGIFDSCSSISVGYTDTSVSGCGLTEIITRTWTATDECGNSASVDQTITVLDTTPPSITAPADVTIECTDDESSASNGVATGSDTCGDVTITESDVVTDQCGNTKTIVRTWTATDECGNA
ncbi:HYR domain-containing protein, partial [Aestuariivivens sediminicola]|uniref:HYR domain-containing protein n=1 Tax=Aestuariivivens sediminicola TaxID=2913560 RepID=UPI001F5A85E1